MERGCHSLLGGNHDTGKIPYAWMGHTPETCLNSTDMHKIYNGTYGGGFIRRQRDSNLSY